MAAALNATPTSNKAKLSKRDAQTIAEGEQISGDIEKRLRSSSGKTYHAGISFQTDSNKMGSIEEVLEGGGIDHAEIQEPTLTAEKGISQLISMVQDLQQTVNSMDQKISANNVFQEKAEARLQSLEKKQADDSRELSALNECFQQTQLKVDILSDIVLKQHQEITELKSQMTDTQARSMKYNIQISGIPEKANENCIREVNQFFADKLLIKDRLIPIDQAYRFGSGRIRPMLVILRSADDKAFIFSQVGNLKNQKVDGVQCFISSQLPEALNEKRRQVNLAMSANKKKDARNKLPLTVKHGELWCNNKPVEQKVKAPTPRQMLQLTEQEIDKYNAIKLIQGNQEDEGDCTFKGFAVSASDHDEVRNAYFKLKLMHGEATHIACAYQFNKVKPPYDQGGCDDGEYGASRTLQQAIASAGVNNVAVFMVRFYGGKKLGPLRFELMRKVIDSALILWQVSPQESLPTDQDPWYPENHSSDEEKNEDQQDEI